MSLFLFAFAGLAPIGGLFAGWLAELGGTPLAFGVAGASGLVAVLGRRGNSSTSRAVRRRPRLEPRLGG